MQSTCASCTDVSLQFEASWSDAVLAPKANLRAWGHMAMLNLLPAQSEHMANFVSIVRVLKALHFGLTFKHTFRLTRGSHVVITESAQALLHSGSTGSGGWYIMLLKSNCRHMARLFRHTLLRSDTFE